MKDKNNKGFTFIDLVVVLAIIGILFFMVSPKIMAFMEESYLSSDRSSIRTLNSMTPTYRAKKDNRDDPFLNIKNTSEELLQILIEEDYVESFIEPQTENASFEWSFTYEQWYLSHQKAFHELSTSDGVLLKENYWRTTIDGEYSGNHSNIRIPSHLINEEVLEIWSSVFENKGLTELDFDKQSKLLRIHSNAFKNNYLTELSLPNSLTRIDEGAFENNQLTELEFSRNLSYIGVNAFSGNNIEKISIKSSIEIETNAFGNRTNSFIKAYELGGPGDYTYTSGVWIKQN